ncbi:MAG: hybrid sensor histidine kinase/response regulator, partial [Candidatus Xenobia bacterium]
MDGLETARLIRQRDRCASTPIIFITAQPRDDHTLLRGYEMGAVDFLYKPVLPEILKSKVAVLVDLWRKTELVRRQAERLSDATQFLNGVLNSATQHSIVALDLEGRVEVWNEGARRLHGVSERDLVGQNGFPLIFAPEEIVSGRVGKLLRTAYHEGKAEGHYDGLRSNDTRFPMSVVLTLRADEHGTPSGYVLIAHDITEQVVLEEELRQRNADLVQQNRRVEQATRLKSEFLATMSHELRTPLNAIIGFTEVLGEGLAGPLNPQQKEYLDTVLTSSKHLLRLINDVLDMARIESGRMEYHFEPVDIKQIVDEACRILRGLSARRQVRLSSYLDPELTDVLADGSKLKQIIYNYLSNALKFTQEDGDVQVKVLADGLERFRIEVHDTGIGIREEDRDRLFVEFQQLETGMTRRYAGTGLGLALTRRIVEGQGGQVGMLDRPGGGSIFFAVLPRHPVMVPSEPRPTTAEPRRHRRRRPRPAHTRPR